MPKTSKLSPRERILNAHKALLTSRAEVADYNEMSAQFTAKIPENVLNEIKSAKTSKDVEKIIKGSTEDVQSSFRILSKFDSAACRYAADVEHLEQKIRYLVFKHASVDAIMANVEKLV